MLPWRKKAWDLPESMLAHPDDIGYDVDYNLKMPTGFWKSSAKEVATWWAGRKRWNKFIAMQSMSWARKAYMGQDRATVTGDGRS